MSELINSFGKISFTQPAYFFLLNILAIMAGFFIVFIILKFFLRPKKSKYSEYRLFGKDWAWLAIIIVCLLSILALAGPRVSSGYAVSQSGSVDVIVILDKSYSMAAHDLDGMTRHETALKIIVELTDDILLKGDRITLFAFGKQSNWMLPLTEDFEYFKVKLAEVDHPDVYYDESQLSTDIGSALQIVEQKISNQENFFKNNAAKLNLEWANNSKIGIILSDGDDHEETDINIGIRKLRDAGVKIYAVGIGTRAGANIVIEAFNSKDTSAPPEKLTVRTALREGILLRIAEGTGGDIVAVDSPLISTASFLKIAVSSNRFSMPRLVYSGEGKDMWWEFITFPSIVMLLFAIWKKFS